MLKIFGYVIYGLSILSLFLLGMAVTAVAGGITIHDCDSFSLFYHHNKLMVCLGG